MGGLDLHYGPDVLRRVRALCEAEPSREVCGFVLRRRGGLEVVSVPNVADRYHAADPGRFPRTSRDSYLMDPKALLAVHREAASGATEIVAVWHSHVEVGAYFSDKDRADALVEGAPVIPGAEYLVVGVRGGVATEVKRYRLDGEAFFEAPLA